MSFQLFFERVLGLIEKINIDGVGPVDAKTDSGNGAFNVLHGEGIKEYGDMINFRTVNNKRITKRIQGYIDINIGSGNIEKRPVVLFNIEVAGKRFNNEPFSIANRADNTEKVLLGKDFIIKASNGIIDVKKENA